jgi:hypothetical protein
MALLVREDLDEPAIEKILREPSAAAEAPCS